MAIVLLVLGVVGAWAVIAYNRLVRDRTRVHTAWSDIDVQLKRRHDLIPKLVEAVKQYAAYESVTLSAVTELRSGIARQTAIADVSATERGLSAEIKKLVAVAEAYPELQANASFLDLQRNLTEVEQHIQFARRFYNGSVRNLNIRVDSFPDSLIARAFGFKAAEFFDYEETAV
jgi:LemA protein